MRESGESQWPCDHYTLTPCQLPILILIQIPGLTLYFDGHSSSFGIHDSFVVGFADHWQPIIFSVCRIRNIRYRDFPTMICL